MLRTAIPSHGTFHSLNSEEALARILRQLQIHIRRVENYNLPISANQGVELAIIRFTDFRHSPTFPCKRSCGVCWRDQFAVDRYPGGLCIVARSLEDARTGQVSNHVVILDKAYTDRLTGFRSASPHCPSGGPCGRTKDILTAPCILANKALAFCGCQ